VDGKKPDRSIPSENFEKPYPPIMYGLKDSFRILALIKPSREL